jgi:hypothetical protein
MSKSLGITVFPEFFQNEGVNPILDHFAEIGVTEITISPWVATPADVRHGLRQPPLDDGQGQVRVHDRLLWGQPAPYLRWSPSYEPNRSLYRGLKYQPAWPDELTAEAGGIVAEIISGAHSRGISSYFQWIPAMPPGLEEEDLPRLPNGQLPRRRLARTGSLASQNILAYCTAYIQDLIEAYPDIDGFRPDWPEYPPYYLESALLDFSVHAEKAASQAGFDFHPMQQAVSQLQAEFSTLANQTLHRLLEPNRSLYDMFRPLIETPAIIEWLALKASLSTQFIAHIRQAIIQAGAADKKLLANAFPPPLSLLSGFDYQQAALICDTICMKFYTMHWPMIVRLFAEQLLAVSPKLDEELLVRVLANLFELVDQTPQIDLATFHYPTPDQAHPAGRQVQRRKINQALAAISGQAKLHPIVHGYGPLDDFCDRLKLVLDSPTSGLWINRYAFLSDAKLGAIKELLAR